MKNSVHGEFKEEFLEERRLNFEFLIGFEVISWIVVWKFRLYVRQHLQIPKSAVYNPYLLKQWLMSCRKFGNTIRFLNMHQLKCIQIKHITNLPCLWEFLTMLHCVISPQLSIWTHLCYSVSWVPPYHAMPRKLPQTPWLRFASVVCYGL